MDNENQIDESVEKFLDENPDVIDVFNELFDRADLSIEEVRVFYNTLYKYCNGIFVSWIEQIIDIIKSDIVNVDEKDITYEV